MEPTGLFYFANYLLSLKQPLIFLWSGIKTKIKKQKFINTNHLHLDGKGKIKSMSQGQIDLLNFDKRRLSCKQHQQQCSMIHTGVQSNLFQTYELICQECLDTNPSIQYIQFPSEFQQQIEDSYIYLQQKKTSIQQMYYESMLIDLNKEMKDLDRVLTQVMRLADSLKSVIASKQVMIGQVIRKHQFFDPVQELESYVDHLNDDNIDEQEIAQLLVQLGKMHDEKTNLIEMNGQFTKLQLKKLIERGQNDLHWFTKHIEEMKNKFLELQDMPFIEIQTTSFNSYMYLKHQHSKELNSYEKYDHSILPAEFIFEDFLDKQGFIYWLGSKGRSKMFQNPSFKNLIQFYSISGYKNFTTKNPQVHLTGDLNILSDMQKSIDNQLNILSNPNKDPEIIIDLIQYRMQSTFILLASHFAKTNTVLFDDRYFTFYGSFNRITWDLIPNQVTKFYDCLKLFQLSESKKYRYFKIQITDKEVPLVLTGIQLYGKVFQQI